jgi:hypothetical protein
MTIRDYALFLLTAGTLAAQIASPRAGFVRYEDRSVRAVYGMPGNLVVESHPSLFADSVSFSDWGGLAADNGRIRLLRRDGSTVAEAPVTDRDVLLNAGTKPEQSVAWLPASHRLLCWTGREFRSVLVNDSAISGTIVSVASLSPTEVRFISTEADGSASAIRISASSGDVLSTDTIAGVRGAAYQIGSFLISANDKGELVLDREGVQENLLCSIQNLSVQRMASDWALLSGQKGSQRWVLYLPHAGRPVVSMLPALPPSLRASASGGALH